MQSKAARLFFFAVIALAVSTSRPSAAQQPATQKQMQAPAHVYQDTQWSPDEDMKSDLRSQEKQIVAANMDRPMQRRRSFGLSMTATQRTWRKSTTQKLPCFKNILRTIKPCLGIRQKVIYAGGPPWNKT